MARAAPFLAELEASMAKGAPVMQQTKQLASFQPDSTQDQRPPPHRLPAPKRLSVPTISVPKLPTPRLTPRRLTPRRPAKEKAVEQRAPAAKREDVPEPYFKPSEVDLSGAAEKLSGMPPAPQIGVDSSSVVAPPVPPLATGLAASLRAALDAALGDQGDALEVVDESDWTPRPQEMPGPAVPRQPQLDLLMHEMLDAQGLPPPVRESHPTAHLDPSYVAVFTWLFRACPGRDRCVRRYWSCPTPTSWRCSRGTSCSKQPCDQRRCERAPLAAVR